MVNNHTERPVRVGGFGLVTKDKWKAENKRIDDEGVCVDKLPTGSRVRVTTRNSVYELTVLGPKGEIEIVGGTNFTAPTKVTLNGSTWGGSMLMMGWVAPGMHMEIIRPGKDCLIMTAAESVELLP